MRVEDIIDKILQGEVRKILSQIPAESIQCAVTSPPYWGLRDYGVDGQLGLEKTPEEYIENMVEVFRGVWRILRKDGTLWLNMGDSYATHASGSKNHSHNFRSPEVAAKQGIGTLKKPTAKAMGLKEKDLCMMPHRLAMALQKPYQNTQIKNEVDKAWAAGIIDGEGCITILNCTSPHGSGNSYPPILQVRMCDKEPLEKLYNITGYGKASPKQEPPSQGGNRCSYQWRIHARKAVDIMAEIYPYLLVKRKQAIVAWNHQIIRESYKVKRGVKIPEDALQKQLFCNKIIKQLNSNEPVDLPSWMKEPKIQTMPGWYVRADCVWHKPNPMPESVTDRPTKSHEYLFLLTKSAKYFYDQDAIREECIESNAERPRMGQGPNTKYKQKRAGYEKNFGSNKGADADRYGKGYQKHSPAVTHPAGRNKRSVWTIPTQAYSEAHFATFPEKLVEPCILAGTSEKGCCPECGAGWVRITEKVMPEPVRSTTYRGKQENQDPQFSAKRMQMFCKAGREAGLPHDNPTIPTKTIGWQPQCKCGKEPIPCLVADIFMGSGTVGLVAYKNRRHYVGIELNPNYCKIAEARIEQEKSKYSLFKE